MALGSGACFPRVPGKPYYPTQVLAWRHGAAAHPSPGAHPTGMNHRNAIGGTSGRPQRGATLRAVGQPMVKGAFLLCGEWLPPAHQPRRSDACRRRGGPPRAPSGPAARSSLPPADRTACRGREYGRPDQPFHFVIDTIGRRAFFAVPRYAEAAFQCLCEGRLFTEAAPIAACLMPGHLHLVLAPTQTNLIDPPGRVEILLHVAAESAGPAAPCLAALLLGWRAAERRSPGGSRRLRCHQSGAPGIGGGLAGVPLHMAAGGLAVAARPPGPPHRDGPVGRPQGVPLGARRGAQPYSQAHPPSE